MAMSSRVFIRSPGPQVAYNQHGHAAGSAFLRQT
jgi:predicted SprT family Zn-dependent metalloprotease